MLPFDLTEALVRQHTYGDTFQRGQEYERRDAVVTLIRRGNLLRAEVEGSQPAPYQVRIAFDAGSITAARCTCPSSWGGWCKHVVAALLVCIHQPDAVEERPTVDALVRSLNRDQLQALLLDLVARKPDLADTIDDLISADGGRRASVAAGSSPEPRPRRVPVDLRAVRREVQARLHSLDRMRRSEAYQHVGGVVAGVRQVMDQAWAFILAGDGQTALDILDAITEEYIAGWELLDDSNGEASGFFEYLGAAWTEAMLTADLPKAKRAAWAEKLDAWAAELDQFGVENAFETAVMAAEQAWEFPPLKRVLRGEITERGAWDDEAPWPADDLAVARLNVLDRQGRHQEYLYLAEAEGQVERYVTMLARLGRVEDAVEQGLRLFNTANEALALAQRLRERGDLEAALRVAEHGLTLADGRASLAVWLCDLASGMGQTERALTAALVAVREAPSLAGYLRVQELAGERWPEHRAALLDGLRRARSFDRHGPIDIFLCEGLVADAMTAVEDAYDDGLVGRVADAALLVDPDWVVGICRRRAESIMDRGKAERYQDAARWLAKAKGAYLAAGREPEWRTYHDELTDLHHRKHKLRPMLEALA